MKAFRLVLLVAVCLAAVVSETCVDYDEHLLGEQESICKQMRQMLVRCAKALDFEIPGDYIALVPKMVSPQAPSGRAFDNGSSGLASRGWRAFDREPNTSFLSKSFPTRPVILGYEFREKVRVDMLELVTDRIPQFRGRIPRDFELQASNGREVWKTLLRVEAHGIGDPMTQWHSKRRGKFKKYRIVVFKDNFNTREDLTLVEVREIQLYRRRFSPELLPCDYDTLARTIFDQKAICAQLDQVDFTCSGLLPDE